MFLDIKGDLPQGDFRTMIPSIDKDPTIPFIVWTPNGPYMQCTSNENVINKFIENIISKFLIF